MSVQRDWAEAATEIERYALADDVPVEERIEMLRFVREIRSNLLGANPFYDHESDNDD